MAPTLATPAVSVIIPAYHPGETLLSCLRSLEDQTATEPFEVILVESSGDDTPARVREGFPWVRVLAFSERKYCGEARNLGIAQAQGDVIAFLDADCTAGRNWIEEILKAHRAGHSVVSGAVENGSRDSLTGWAYYFAEFSQWIPRGFEGPARDIAGCCLAMDRATFEQHGPFLEGTYCSDTAFQWKMGRAGIRAHWTPSVRVAHHLTRRGLGAFLSHEVRHGRSFAAVRTREERASGARRAARVVGTPLLPLLLFCRIFARVVGARRLFLPFLLASPLVLLGVAAWSWGELLGYLTAAGSGAGKWQRTQGEAFPAEAEALGDSAGPGRRGG